MKFRKIFFIILVVPILLVPACLGKKEPKAITENEKQLAQELGFDQKILETVKGYASVPVSQMVGIDENFEEVQVPGLVFKVSSKNTEEALFQLRKKLSGTGYTAYIVKRNFGYSPDIVGVLKGTDPYELLRLKGTNGINYDITNADVIRKLRKWQAQYHFDIIAVEFDSLEAIFEDVPADMDRFAREVYEFCPDVVDQGVGSVEALAEEMRRTGRLYLWWD